MNYMQKNCVGTMRYGISENPFLPAIVPVAAVALMYLFLFTQPSTEAQYEAGVGQNEAHTSCLDSAASSHNFQYKNAQIDYIDDLGRAETAYSIQAAAAFATWVESSRQAAIRFAGNLAALIIAEAAILAVYVTAIAVARSVRDRAFTEARDDFNRETDNISEAFILAEQACDDAHANQLFGDSYETDPNGIFDQGFNWDGYNSGCGVRNHGNSGDSSGDKKKEAGNGNGNGNGTRC